MRRAVWTAALALAMAGAAGAEELKLFAWSEYVPRAVIDGFTRETGIVVHYDTFASNEEMFAKLVSGAERYDLIQPSEYAVEALVKAGRLLVLDHAKLPGLGNIAPEYRGLPHDPELRYSVPWMAGSVGIVVNTGRVKEEIRGYRDVFRKEHAGRIVVVDDAGEMVGWALVTLGKEPNDVTPENLAAAKPLLQEWLSLVRVFDSDSPKTPLLNGDVDLGIVWSGEAAILHREDPKFRYVLPAEGAHRFIDNLSVPADARNPDGAHRFIEYVLRPEVSRLISREFPYTNPNLAARKLLTPEELSNPASYPPGQTKFHTFRDIGEAAVSVDKLVTDLKAAL